ncbi:radical SAM family heme chaperone HemW [Flagellatimonas centrodinii]|uniref:radical SAM family heme chaperone HemW n=1 Tax=Flagellatimonas centrodinii TaxID=2806210 RepID=UPI001FF00B0D|nr:radical SAM family heme chaperone HemW [Flagellatimonas centrodinii]ULQ47921.1 radical SAM family heme chaperone HemW [Flagellatimonas centrodinii]
MPEALALYVHFPWCVRKCPYCDFNSHARTDAIPEQAYVDALLRDLALELRDAPARAFTSLFLGGGTPSLFSGTAMQRLLAGIHQLRPWVADAEITLEANPGTIDEAHFRDYRRAGINRLSIGVQSFNPAHLTRLGRIHSGADAERAVETAGNAGFDNFNLDLMFGLPAQTPAEAEADLARALALAPQHLSYYQLTLEPNTAFAAAPPTLPDDDTVADMQLQGQATLAAAGFQQYEVSAYARDGRRSRHNETYWTFGDYLGIGAGAHGKLTTADGVIRRARHKLPKTYLRHAGSAEALQEDRRVPTADLPFEFMLNALRRVDGFAPEDFERATGLSFTVLMSGLERARAQGLLADDPERVRASKRGYRYLNRLVGLFLT